MADSATATTTTSAVREQPTYDAERKIFQSPFKPKKAREDAMLPGLILDQPHFDPDGPDAARAAVIDGHTGESYRFGELRELTARCAAALAARGFKAGDNLTMALPNVREHAVATFAVLSLGGTVSSVNPLSSSDEFARYLTVSGAKWVVTVPDGFLRGLQPMTNLLDCEARPSLRRIFVVGGNAGDHAAGGAQGLVEPFSQLLDSATSAAPVSLPAPVLDSDALAFLMFSSGTSGQPKGVRLTQRSVCGNLAQLDAVETTSKDDTLLAFLPFANAFGLLYALVHSLFKGATVVTMPRFKPDACLELVQKHRATRMPAAPPVIKLFATHPSVSKYDLSSLKMVSSGGSRLEPAHRDAMMARWAKKGWNDMRIRQGFGMTELSPVMCINADEDADALAAATKAAGRIEPPAGGVKPVSESVGILLPDTEVRVVQLESGDSLGPNEEGEIWVRGPQVMAGYLLTPEEEADGGAPSPVDEDGWLRTGDIGYFNEAGYYFITDRLKELIKYKGYQVAPAELEAELSAMPGVLDSCVIGVSDEEAGELPKAYVVRDKTKDATRDASEDVLTASAVLEFIAARVAPYKKLRLVEFVPCVPRAKSGKLLRRLVKQQTGRIPSMPEGYEDTGVAAVGIIKRQRVDRISWDSVGGVPDHLVNRVSTKTRKSFDEYIIELRLLDGEVLTIAHRYRRFLWLHRALCSIEGAAAVVPALPPKGERNLGRREAALRDWLSAVLQARVLIHGEPETLLMRSAALRVFLGVSAQRLRRAATNSPGAEAGLAEVDPSLTSLHAKRGEWAALPAARKLALIRESQARLASIDHEEWSHAACAAGGLNEPHPANDLWRAVELITNIATISTQLEGYAKTLKELVGAGEDGTIADFPSKVLPAAGVAAAEHAQGQDATQRVVRMFPRGMGDSMHPKADWSVDVWLEPGKPASRAGFYSRLGEADGSEGSLLGPRRHDGTVSVVLGAGNAGFLSIVDTLHLLFERGMVVATKHSDVRSYNQLFFDFVFEPFVLSGYVRSLTGGIAAGAALVQDDRVGHVHMTGGAPTHDIIVWGGSEEERAANRAAKTPVLRKPITSELGCVTPYIVAPAQYTAAELRHHAMQLCIGIISNNSCNCLSPKLLLISDGWRQADEFLRLLREELSTKPLLPAYYPGTHRRYGNILGEYSRRTPDGFHVDTIQTDFPPPEYGDAFGERLPWGLIEMPASIFEEGASDELALRNEPFCPVISIARVPSDGAATFLSRAVSFCNERVLGTLSCNLIVHPSIERAEPSTVQRAIAALRYGTIGINTWCALAYSFDGVCWGAFPGEPLEAVESGMGFVRNSAMLDWPQKSVVRSPFVSSEHAGCGPKLLSERKAIATARYLCKKSTWNLVRMLMSS